MSSATGDSEPEPPANSKSAADTTTEGESSGAPNDGVSTAGSQSASESREPSTPESNGRQLDPEPEPEPEPKSGSESESEGWPSREQISAETREFVLERDRNRCQLCSAAGIEAGGPAVLQVHHKKYDPEVCDVHDAENLITLCRTCHNWAHKRPSTSDVPVELSDDAQSVLLEHDYEILQVAAAYSPLSTSELVERLTADLSTMAVRERLWLLMGLDNVCESQESRVLDQDVKTGEWGLPGQITCSERGRIPEDRQTLIQRVEDERVRRALNRGCSREEVAEVLDMHPRTTRHKERRARAYAFPLDAFTSHGRPPTEASDEDTETDSEMRPQQRLEAVSGASESYTPRGDASSASMDGHEESGSGDGDTAETDAVAVEATDTVAASEELLSVAAIEDVDAYPPHLQPLVEALAVMRKQQ